MSYAPWSMRPSRRPAPVRYATSGRSWATSCPGRAAVPTASVSASWQPRHSPALIWPGIRRRRTDLDEALRGIPMLTMRAESTRGFGRRDFLRLAGAAAVLILVVSTILGIDVLLPQPLNVQVGDVARFDIVSPRTTTLESAVQTEALREQARKTVEPQYSYTTGNAIAVASEQLTLVRRSVASIDNAFEPDVTPKDRQAILADALPSLSTRARETLQSLTSERRTAVKEEALRVLDATERTELRDSDVAETRSNLVDRMAGGLDAAEGMLAAEIISPYVVPNSSFSQEATNQQRDRVAAAVQPVKVPVTVNQVIIRSGDVVTPASLEIVTLLGLTTARPDIQKFGGWVLLATLLVGLLLAWVWRFRRDLWHRNNVLLLFGVLLVFAAIALKLTAQRAALPFIMPVAAVGMLVAVLLDAGAATVV